MGSRRAINKLLRCRPGLGIPSRALFRGFLPPLHALSGLAFAVHVDALLEGGGECTARLVDGFTRAGAGAGHFELDLGREGSVPEHANAVAAALYKPRLSERLLRDLCSGVDLFPIDRFLDT